MSYDPHPPTGGGTTVTDATIATSDITTNNASATKHGWLIKLANTATKFLRDDGTWQTIAGGGDALIANGFAQFAPQTSAQLAATLSDETGTNKAVFSDNPTLVAPVLGAATATTVNKVALTPVATGATVTLTDGVTLTVPANANIQGTHSGTSSGTNTGDQTLSDATISTTDITTNNFTTAKHGFVPKGTNVGSFLKDDGTWAAIPGGGDALTSNPLSQFAATTSLQLKNTISDETGSGALVFGTSPTLTTPDIGVATATSVNKVAFTAPATSATVAITDGKTLTVPLDATVSGTNTGDQPGGYKSKTTLTSGTAQTYTQPAGIGRIEVHGTASGGSGAGVAAASASQCTLASGGGSGGRFIKGYVRAAGSTYTYTVGAAATGGAASASAGADGNDTTFTDGTTLCTAKAGKGAPASLASAATTLFLQCGQGGATSTNGDSNYGGTGGPCGTRSGTGGSGQCISGGGGGPGGGEQRVTSGAGIAGKGPGDGGGGALGLSGASAALGGDSFRGEIVIYEYAS